MPKDRITNNKIMKVLEEILANKGMIQKVRELNFDKEVQVKYEINELIARKDEELEHIVLRNRHLGRPDRDREYKIIGETEKSIKGKKNELKNSFVTDNDLIDSLLGLDEDGNDI